MTRGRIPVRALERARQIAEQRGWTQQYLRGPERVCDFSIFSPGLLAEVRVRCVRRLRCLPAEIDRDLSDELAMLRLVTPSSGISRELWLCSPRYAWRFFRVLDDGLVEIDRDGREVPAGGTRIVPVKQTAPAHNVTADRALAGMAEPIPGVMAGGVPSLGNPGRSSEDTHSV